jgi:hypothetical protein
MPLAVTTSTNQLQLFNTNQTSSGAIEQLGGDDDDDLEFDSMIDENEDLEDDEDMNAEVNEQMENEQSSATNEVVASPNMMTIGTSPKGEADEISSPVSHDFCELFAQKVDVKVSVFKNGKTTTERIMNDIRCNCFENGAIELKSLVKTLDGFDTF